MVTVINREGMLRMNKKIPKYIVDKMKKVEKYRDMVSTLSGEVDRWIFDNTGLDTVNDTELQKEMYELMYECGSTETMLELIEDKLEEG